VHRWYHSLFCAYALYPAQAVSETNVTSHVF